MSAPTEPSVLADTGGLIVTDDGRRVLAVAGFGAVALATGMPSRALGVLFLAIGVVLAGTADRPLARLLARVTIR